MISLCTCFPDIFSRDSLVNLWVLHIVHIPEVATQMDTPLTVARENIKKSTA